MHEPLVTIFTPVYNHENYLEEYLESIINQTYQNIELILIDDASPDASQLVIEKWISRLEKRFNKFTYIPRTENKGLIFNCNESLGLAQGKYIYGFASDDVMLPKNIEKKVQFLEENKKYAMVYSGMYTGDSLSNKLKIKKVEVVGEKDDMLKRLVEGKISIPAPTVMINKMALVDVGGYNSKYFMEDYPLWIEMAYNYKIAAIEEPLIFYRQTPNSLTKGIENLSKLLESHKMILIDVKDKYGINIEQGIENLNLLGMKYSLLNEEGKREMYTYHRRKLKNPTLIVLTMDLLVKLNIQPSVFLFLRTNLMKLKSSKVFNLIRRN